VALVKNGSLTPIFCSRRDFFARIAALFGGMGLAGCGRGKENIDAASLDALLDTLIPADDDPGAVAAGVPEAALARMEIDIVSRNRYRRLLAWTGEQSMDLHQRPFAELSLRQRDRILKGLYRSDGDALRQLRIDLQVVRRDTFLSFYSSPAARRVIGYHPPIEGGYPDYAKAPAPLNE
jgi:hypothetical protein